jgi:hypothetical protein
MITSSTNSGFKFILFKAPFMAIAPNFGAGTVDKFPIKLPIGVLAADTITTSLLIFKKFYFYSCKINQILGDYRTIHLLTKPILIGIKLKLRIFKTNPSTD